MFGIQAGMIWDLLMKAIKWSLHFFLTNYTAINTKRFLKLFKMLCIPNAFIILTMNSELVLLFVNIPNVKMCYISNKSAQLT